MEAEDKDSFEQNSQKLFFHCPFECGKVYLLERNLKGHVEKNHTKGEEQSKCEICFADFKSTREVSLHAEMCHSPEKIIKCDCGKVFETNSRYNIHLRTHTGAKPFECEICRKSFSEKGNLKVHERIHTGDKPFQCEIDGCGLSFRSQGNYINHVNSHLGLRPFQCDLCSKSFTRKYVLKKHKLCHIERNFKCEHCQKSYKSLLSLGNHIKVKHLTSENSNSHNNEGVALTPPPNLEKLQKFHNSDNNEPTPATHDYITCNINIHFNSHYTCFNNDETITEKEEF